MTQAAEEILQKARQLPEEEWGSEIQRRIAEIDEGKVQLIPGNEVMARLRARLAR